MKTHTAGEWTVEGSTQTVVMCDGVKVAKASYDMLPSQEAQANARLIAEAGTVANETGLTPRQLQAINAELVEACEFAMKYHGMHLEKGNGHEFPSQLANTISKAIARAKSNP